MTKAIFLDRDGTINEDIPYIHEIEKFKLIPRSLDALKLLSKTNYKLIIITNQSGIGRGKYTEDDYDKITLHMLSLLSKGNIHIDKIYHCSHKPEDECSCRKPNQDLVKQAQKEFDIDLENSWFIGDSTHDIKAGENAGMQTILLETGKAGSDNKYPINPTYKKDDLYSAVLQVLKSNKVIPLDELLSILPELRKDKKIISTNGVFDLIHTGHIHFLNQAKKLGDFLIVGLNSDSSVKKFKDSNRPIIPQEQRAEVLSALNMIDFIVLFDEKTPINFLEKLKPDIHVKGSDYKKEELPEKQAIEKNNGEIHIVKSIPGISTTNLINKILETYKQ